jgi:hypothetical protein
LQDYAVPNGGGWKYAIAKEGVIVMLETDPASLQNVTALPKRDADAPHPDPASPPNVMVGPRSQADLDNAQPPPADDDEISVIDHGLLAEKLSEAELMLAHAAETYRLFA